MKEKRTRRTRRSGKTQSVNSRPRNTQTAQTRKFDGETGSGSRNPDELIDAHRDSILSHIASNRVTVITGERAAGSHRVCRNFCSSSLARLMVAQPRRITFRTR